MGKVSTYPTIAGQHHTTHEPGGEDVVAGVAPGAHEATHVQGGADDIDAVLDARALGLTAQGEIVFHAAAANTLATLAVGAAGEALLSGGAAADVSWGAPAPAAHVLATTGPHSAPLPLIDLEVGVQGEVIHRGAADWEALAVGAAGEVLTSGGAGVDVSWAGAAADTRTSTIVVAASNSLDPTLAPAAYRCSGANDNVEINAALVAAAAVNGSVMLLEGDYNTVLTLSVAVNVSLKGVGWGAVINFNAGGNAVTIAGDNVKLRDFKVVIVAGAGAGGSRPNAVYATARTNVEITKLWLYGDQTEADDGTNARQVGILFGINMAYSKILACTIQNFERHGIYLNGTTGNEHTYIEIAGNICYSNLDDGIGMDYALHSTVTGNTCQGNTTNGIVLLNSDNSTVTGNTCQGNTEDGIALYSMSDNTVSGNTCQGNDNGIYLTSSSNNAVTGNTCQGNTANGIYVYASFNNTVTGISCNENVQHGIFVDRSNYCTIVGNTCIANDSGNTNTYDGICIEDDSDYTLVMGNTCNDNDRWGISIGIAADDCVGNWVKDNHLRGNTSGPFSDQGTDTKLATLQADFVHAVGGAFVDPVINTSPGGIDLDADGEIAMCHIKLPPELQLVVRIQIWAYSNVIEAVNNMLLQFNIHGATSSELWNTHSIDVADHPSEETGGIVVGDVIHWIIDATDDADVAALAACDKLEILAVGEGASAPDIATDALFGVALIEYV